MTASASAPLAPRPRYKVADERRGVFVGDTAAGALAAYAEGERRPAWTGTPGLITWLAGRWWQWAGEGWAAIARGGDSVRWGDPLELSPEWSASVRAQLEASGREPVAATLSDGAWYLFAAERGKPAMRRALASPLSLGELAPPPTPEEVLPFVDWKKSLERAAEQISRDFRRREVFLSARAVAGTVPGVRGRPNVRGIMRALFLDQKARAPFQRDPYGSEHIASTESILCLPGAECVHGGDCDDQIVALASRALAVGIPCIIRARKFVGRRQPHADLIYNATPSDARETWEGIDPSTEDGRASSLPHEEEYLVHIDTSPQFVGLGDPPAAGGEELGAPASPSTVQLQAMDQATADAWVGVLAQVKATFDASIANLSNVATEYAAVRGDLGLPATDDASSSSTTAAEGGGAGTSSSPIASYVQSVAAGKPVWTSDAQAAEAKLLTAGAFFSQAMGDALAGTRRLVYDAQGAIEGRSDLLIEAFDTDPYRVLLVKQSDGSFAPEWYDTSSNTATAGTLGNPVYILIGLGLVAAVGLAAAYAYSKYCDYAAQAHRDDVVQKINDNQTQLINSGQMTPAQAVAQTQALTAAAAAMQPPPQTSTDSTIATVAKVIAVVSIAAAVGTGLVVLKEFLPRRSSA